MPAKPVSITATAQTITYNISYDLQGGKNHKDNPANYNVETPTFEIKAPTRVGYDFVGWSEFDETHRTYSVTSGTHRDISLTAMWEPRNDTVWNYEVYTQDLDLADYTKYSTSEPQQGTSDAPIILNEITSVTGFTYDHADVENATIAPDGSTVVKLYFNRNQYNVTVNKGTGIVSVTGSDTYYYEEIVSVSATVHGDYNWLQWTSYDLDRMSTDPAFEFKMPAKDVSLTAEAVHKEDIEAEAEDISTVYTESEQVPEPVVSVSVPESGYTIKYGTKPNDCKSSTVPARTDVGKYQIYYQVTHPMYMTFTGSFNWDITPATPTLKAPTALSLTYNGKAQALVRPAEVNHGKVQYSLDNNNWTDGVSVGTNAGTYTVFYKVVSTDKNWSGLDSKSLTVTISKADPAQPDVKAKDLTFNYNAQALVSAASYSDGTIMYNLNDGDWSKSIPSGTNATTYKVGYYVKGDSNHLDSTPKYVSVTIKTKDMTVSDINGLCTYSGVASDGNAHVNVEEPHDATIKYGTTSDNINSATIPKFTNAGKYTVYYKVTAPNFTTYNDSFTITITKAASTVAPPSDRNSVYTGKAVPLVNAGKTTTGTLKYSMDGVAWSTDIPTATNAGSYTVKYKVIGDSNHEDSEVKEITAHIGKATPVVTKPVANTLTYNGRAQELVSPATTTGGTVEYSLNGTEWSATIPKGTNAGNYTVYYRVVGNANYDKVGQQSVSAKINKAQPALPDVKAKDLTFNYKEQELVNAASYSDGTIMYNLNDGDWSASVPRGTHAATYKVGYYVKGDSNHLDSEPKYISVVIKNKGMIVSATNGLCTYSGSASDGNACVNVEEPLGATVKYGTTPDDINSTTIPKFINAGKYTVYYKVTAPNFNTYTNSFTITITKAASTVVAPSDRNSVYTGTALPLVNGGSTTTGTLQYSLDGVTWSTNIPTAVNAGSYTVKYRVLGDSNHENVEVREITAHIGKATPVVTKPVANKLTYNGGAQQLVSPATTTGGTIQYSLNNTEWGTNIPKGTNAGTYTVYYRIVSNTNYTSVDSKSLNVTINKAQSTQPDVKAKDLTFNSNAQELVNKASSTDGTVMYNLNDGDWSASVPKGTNATTYKVGYYVKGNSNHLDSEPKYISVVIKTKGMNVSATNGLHTYNGSESDGNARVNVKEPTNTSIKYSTTRDNINSSSIPKFTNAGTYTVYYKVTAPNYTTYSNSFTITIAKAASTATAPSDKNSVYNGKALQLVNAGKTNTGTLQYSLDGVSWSTSIPTSTNAGSYTVKYRVLGDSNHENLEVKEITAHICKATPVVTKPVAKSLTYNGAAQELTSSATTTAGTVQYSLNGTDWSTNIPRGTNAGTYTVHYRVVGNANYMDVNSNSLNVTINKASNAISLASTSGSGSPTVQVNFTNKGGNVTAKYDTTKVTVSLTANKLVVTAKEGFNGTTDVSITSDSNTNYTTCTVTYKFSHTHSYTVQSGVEYTAATCTASQKLYYKCNCNYNPKSSSYVYTGTNALGHAMSNSRNGTKVSDATCTAAAVYKDSCTRCGADASTTHSSGSALGHTGDNTGSTIKAATCTATGSRYKKCTRCSANYDSVTLPALGHTGDKGGSTIKAATCTATGSRYKKCTRCDANYDSVTLSALGHDYSSSRDGSLVSNATCTAAAVYKDSCTRCGADASTTHSSGSALGHTGDNGGSTIKAATCKTDGSRYKKCTRCSANYDSVTLPALGHNISSSRDGSLVRPATCTTAAVYKDSCIRCGINASTTHGSGSALGHTGDNGGSTITAATCTANGSRYVNCTRCNTAYTTTVLSALGHRCGDDGKCTICKVQVPAGLYNYEGILVESWDNLIEQKYFKVENGKLIGYSYVHNSSGFHYQGNATDIYGKKLVIPTGISIISGSSTPAEPQSAMYYIHVDKIIMPETITTIEKDAFARCKSLTSVTIPSSVTEIGSYAFYNCSSLTSVAIPSSVSGIKDSTFYNCSSLTSVTIPSSVRSIGYGAFYNCSSLTSVDIPSSTVSIGTNAFYNVPHIYYNGSTTKGRPWGAKAIN